MQDVRLLMPIHYNTQYQQGYPCVHYRTHKLGVGEHFAYQSLLRGTLGTVISFGGFVLGRVRDPLVEQTQRGYRETGMVVVEA